MKHEKGKSYVPCSSRERGMMQARHVRREDTKETACMVEGLIPRPCTPEGRSFSGAAPCAVALNWAYTQRTRCCHSAGFDSRSLHQLYTSTSGGQQGFSGPHCRVSCGSLRGAVYPLSLVRCESQREHRATRRACRKLWPTSLFHRSTITGTTNYCKQKMLARRRFIVYSNSSER